jgi:L-type amino acid transporter 5
MLVSKDVYVLINYTSFVESIFMGMSVVGLLYLRWKRPNMQRPIKVSLKLRSIFSAHSVEIIIITAYLKRLNQSAPLLRYAERGKIGCKRQ